MPSEQKMAKKTNLKHRETPIKRFYCSFCRIVESSWKMMDDANLTIKYAVF